MKTRRIASLAVLLALASGCKQQHADGKLYLAGTDNGSRSVISLDTSAEPYKLEVVLKYGSTIDTAFTVGTFRRAADVRPWRNP